MSASFNKLLLDPGEAALTAALDEVAENDEGRTQLEHATAGGRHSRYVFVAWWSDHQRRKHVRVTGGDTGLGGRDWHHSRLDDDPRPPIWHISPQRIFRVKRGDAEPAWLAACGC